MENSILMWNRLEGAIRNENQIETALSFEIRDALWMLTRQWQFGEFEGEDAGTAAFARIESVHTEIGLTSRIGGELQPFDIQNAPLEMAFESENIVPEIAQRLEMARHWNRLLIKHLGADKAANIFPKYKANKRFHFRVPEQDDMLFQFQHAQTLSDEKRMLELDLLKDGRALDGFALFLELNTGKPASLFVGTVSDEKLDAAGLKFVDWYKRVLGQYSATPNTWHAQHLEYQPRFAFLDEDEKTLRSMSKSEYFGEGISWHGFIADAAPNVSTSIELPANKVSRKASHVIPSSVRFRGMPSKRLWEMEDAQVDFGSIRAASTEISKMLYAEFGLIYSNDWLTAPVILPTNALCKISGLRVVDIFGRVSHLEEIKPDKHWAFMQTPGSDGQKNWLFTASSAAFIQESEPIEKVILTRDEVANLVWAIEEKIMDTGGGGRAAADLARALSQWLNNLQPISNNFQSGQDGSDHWVYKAGTPLPENLIPFIPIAQSASNQAFGKRKVILQRAALPRVLGDLPPMRVRPRTTLLGAVGGLEVGKLLPFYIFEEEIPRAGTVLQLVWKRTRWSDGTSKTWLAKKKTTGRGETNAHFRFDTLERS